MIENRDKIMEGLEKSFQNLIEYKKYKKTPLIISKNGKIIEVEPDKIVLSKHNR